MGHVFEIESEMFKALPKLTVFVGVVHSIDPEKLKKEAIGKFLEESWMSARKQTSEYPNVQSHPQIQLWRQAFQSLKISTKKYASSVESLAKRAAKENSKPFSINPLVDFYNAFSLKYLIPFGGFDMNSEGSKIMSLRFSKAGDKFLALDSDAPIDIPAGEPLYASGNTCTTRYINWKQSKEGLIEATTTDVCFVAEVLDGYPNHLLDEMKSNFGKYCLALLGAEGEVHMVDESSPLLEY